MKEERYLAALDNVTKQAETLWDIERMRKALAQSRSNLERRSEALKQAEFRSKMSK